jgi:hypothetical protein
MLLLRFQREETAMSAEAARSLQDKPKFRTQECFATLVPVLKGVGPSGISPIGLSGFLVLCA